jgi:hypothetical protein
MLRVVLGVTNRSFMLSVIMLSIIILSIIMLSIIILDTIMLNVTMPNVVTLVVVMLNVVPSNVEFIKMESSLHKILKFLFFKVSSSTFDYAGAVL